MGGDGDGVGIENWYEDWFCRTDVGTLTSTALGGGLYVGDLSRGAVFDIRGGKCCVLSTG